jgi:DNA-binding NtrC family response regulator
MNSEPLKNKYSVLVIDDQDNWRELLSEVLGDRFEVMSASDYHSARHMIDNQKPPFHVVVSDMRLRDEEVGNEDGLRLIEHLNRLGDETKTILVTGYPTIATAKRALSQLAAYDYLEKHPADGSGFDIEKFQHTVYAAAQEAEKMRPNGLGDVNYSILLLEPDPLWRCRLEEILRKEGYQVTTFSTDEHLEIKLGKPEQDFALILLSEELSSEGILQSLHLSYPNGKIVILTFKDIDNILHAMRKYPVSAVTLPNEGFDTNTFREFIHSTLSYGAIKYISVSVYPQGNAEQILSSANIIKVLAGQDYRIELSIQDSPAENGTGIWFLPREQKRGMIELHLFIHASRMKLDRGTDSYWKIPLSDKRPHKYTFSINPQAVGNNLLTVELMQEQRWLARISLDFEVAEETTT